MITIKFISIIKSLGTIRVTLTKPQKIL